MSYSDNTKRVVWESFYLRKLVEYLLPFELYLDTSQKMIICPFHLDSSPSAKFFTDDSDGIIRLFCFSENRQFTVFDYLQLMGISPLVVLEQEVPDESVLMALLRQLEQEGQIQRSRHQKKLLSRIDHIFQQSPCFRERLFLAYQEVNLYE